MMGRDTIVAVATAGGRAAIGVVRVSGTGLSTMAERLTGHVLEPRRATLVPFRDARNEIVDEGIALYFPAPNSYTGEDVLELQGHGGPVVLRSTLKRCLELGARLAEPGEFTQRAFLNGKLDLVQAEGVIDLIDASTAEAARSAVRSLKGEFSSAIQRLAARIIELRALVEAALDFPEDDVDPLDAHHAQERLAGVRGALDAVLLAARRGSVLREGVHIALAGQPNVGKSSLINRLTGEDLAIVTDIPGTTRDAIRQVIDLGGVPAHVIDTAGLREAVDPVERIGIERAWGAISAADAVVLVADTRAGATAADDAILQRLPKHVPLVVAMNKIDLLPREPRLEVRDGRTVVWVSAKTGAGVELLRDALRKLAGVEGGEEGVFLARERHLRALGIAQTHLAAAAEQRAPELFAEELRRAHNALASVTGEFGADDLLGEIFQRFCIGK
jgi:tRNA modification GTPase